MPQWRKIPIFYNTSFRNGCREDVLANRGLANIHQNVWFKHDGPPAHFSIADVFTSMLHKPGGGSDAMYLLFDIRTPRPQSLEFLLLRPSEIVCVGYTRVYDHVKDCRCFS
ncbi:hypothetical protein TNCV_3720841 [Trichonephila clavipes]|nr:hypothetical protein TNCV_3720841 [Trichonephila clavipes]